MPSNFTDEWFKETFGRFENSYRETIQWFTVREEPAKYFWLKSIANNKEFYVGSFACPTLSTLLRNPASPDRSLGVLRFQNIGGDVKALHYDPANAGAVFQVASQFNCLEAINPNCTPLDGVTCYYMDQTQGPFAAMCCPAATVFRNYFVGGMGQTLDQQLDLLKDVTNHLGTKYWSMKNGYLMPLPGAMAELSARLNADPALRQRVMELVRVGVHWDTQVGTENHRVCQVFCSAVPVAYTIGTPVDDWVPFAPLVLEGAYTATLAAAKKLAAERRQRIKVYLTSLGGGAFGNPQSWIAEAMEAALMRFRDAPLDVVLVHYMAVEEGMFTALERKMAAL